MTDTDGQGRTDALRGELRRFTDRQASLRAARRVLLRRTVPPLFLTGGGVVLLWTPWWFTSDTSPTWWWPTVGVTASTVGAALFVAPVWRRSDWWDWAVVFALGAVLGILTPVGILQPRGWDPPRWGPPVVYGLLAFVVVWIVRAVWDLWPRPGQSAGRRLLYRWGLDDWPPAGDPR